jgi:hypothetical protein
MYMKIDAIASATDSSTIALPPPKQGTGVLIFSGTEVWREMVENLEGPDLTSRMMQMLQQARW